jgi:hypothetical protein
MIRIPKVTMTMRELDRLKCIQGLIEGQLKQHAVATRLRLTTRQVRRLVRQYEQQGPVGLISKLRNRPSNRRLKSDVAEHAFGILRSTYADFGPTLAAEKLRERHGVDLAVETVRSLMVAGGLWLPRRLRAPKIQQPRNRRACLGELIQIDGCDHRWFEGRAPACTALVFVDDATSRLMVVLFTGVESTFSYFEATRQLSGMTRILPLSFHGESSEKSQIASRCGTNESFMFCKTLRTIGAISASTLKSFNFQMDVSRSALRGHHCPIEPTINSELWITVKS